MLLPDPFITAATGGLSVFFIQCHQQLIGIHIFSFSPVVKASGNLGPMFGAGDSDGSGSSVPRGSAAFAFSLRVDKE
jgi:hypothetical protein